MSISGWTAFRLAKDYIDGVVAALSPTDVSDRAARELGKVDVIDSVLPTGAATETTLDAVKTAVGGTLDTQLTGSKAEDYESLTVDNTGGGVAFTVATVGTAIKAFITCETAQVRFTTDGTAPTTTEGHLLNPGDILKLDSNDDILAFRAIRTGATSGVLKATFQEVA